jgi:nucleoside-diphosphate-sugar epimerase
MTDLLAEVSGGGVTVVPALADGSPVRSPLRRSIADISRLRTATGWAPTIPLRQSLADLVAALPPESTTP